MIAIQKPVSLFPSPASYRPNHARHPSAPVVIRPTQTPGLLSLSKPPQQHPSKPQQTSTQYARAQRQSPKGKAHRSSQPASVNYQSVEDDKKASPTKQRAVTTSEKAAKSATAAPSSDKSARGRQHSKPAAKDKADRSISQSRANARRLPHQPSPPPTTRIPQQTESARPSVNPLRAQSFVHRDQDSNLFDPFVVNSTSDNENTEPSPKPASTIKNGDKALAFRAPPQLNSRPTGKLARRRQSGQTGTPTPSKPVPLARSKGNNASPATTLSKSTPATTFMTPQRPASRRVSTGLPVTDWDEFPVCDDMTVVSSPTTPIRESASVPPKRSNVTWQQSLLDDAPRTAPLSSSYSSYSFPATAPFATPSPANRRRNHHRVPSEGVFTMSTDEEGSSDSSDELKNVINKLLLSGKPRPSGAQRTPPPPGMLGIAGFYAGSIFQNSPSPDELPVPAF